MYIFYKPATPVRIIIIEKVQIIVQQEDFIIRLEKMWFKKIHFISDLFINKPVLRIFSYNGRMIQKCQGTKLQSSQQATKGGEQSRGPGRIRVLASLQQGSVHRCSFTSWPRQRVGQRYLLCIFSGTKYKFYTQIIKITVL